MKLHFGYCLQYVAELNVEQTKKQRKERYSRLKSNTNEQNCTKSSINLIKYSDKPFISSSSSLSSASSAEMNLLRISPFSFFVIDGRDLFFEESSFLKAN